MYARHDMCDEDQDCNSPEYLIPSRDPYSSDADEEKGVSGPKRAKLEMRKRTSQILNRKNPQSRHNKIKNSCKHVEDYLNNTILPNPTCSSKLLAEEVLFFFDIDFIPQSEEIDLNSLSGEDILRHLLEFAFEDIEHSHLCNKTVTEIYTEALKEKQCLSWMKIYDTLNLNEALKKEKMKHVKLLQEGAKTCKDDVKLMKNFLIKLYQDDFNAKDHDCWKSDMYRIGNALGIDLRYSGEVKHRLDYDIPYDVATEDSGIFETRYLSIVVEPSIVFLEEQCNLQEIAIEVISPEKNTSKFLLEDSQNPSSVSSVSFGEKPIRELNGILDNNYRTHARKYIKKSLPSPCHDLKFMNKIAGQHVLQLLSLADKRSRNLPYNSCQIIGLFLIKNCVYFSKMDIFADRLKVMKRSEESYFENADIPPKQRKQTTQEKENRCFCASKTILYKYHDSAILNPEVLHFFTKTEYKRMFDEVSLDDSSVEDCLSHILQFISNKEQCNDNKREFCWKGKTMKDIMDRFDSNPGMTYFKWIKENDKVDWKSSSNDEKKLAEKYFTASSNINLAELDLQSTTICDYSLFVTSILNLYKEVCKQDTGKKSMLNDVKDVREDFIKETDQSWTNVDLGKRRDLVKEYLEHLGGVTYHQRFIKNEKCRMEFPLFVQPDDISENSPLIQDRHSTVIVQPDGVFCKFVSDQLLQFNMPVWMIVVQVFGPTSDDQISQSKHNKKKQRMEDVQFASEHSDSPTAFTKVGRNNTLKNEGCSNNQSCKGVNFACKEIITECSSVLGSGSNKNRCAICEHQHLLLSNKGKPESCIDIIADKDYCDQVIRYISASLPSQCRSSHYRNQIAGQHVMQLLTAAKQNLLLCENVHKGIQKSIGMFVVNEYVYFSKLLVNKFLLLYLNEGVDHLKKWAEKPPVVSYSNFRLDLTIAKHRIALVIFLYEFLLEQQNDVLTCC